MELPVDEPPPAGSPRDGSTLPGASFRPVTALDHRSGAAVRIGAGDRRARDGPRSARIQRIRATASLIPNTKTRKFAPTIVWLARAKFAPPVASDVTVRTA